MKPVLEQQSAKSFLFFFLIQPSFLASHQRKDSAAAVSIPVTASTHFRAISDAGPGSPPVYTPLPGETTALEGDKDTEENRSEAGLGLTVKSGYTSGEEHGKITVSLDSGLKLLQARRETKTLLLWKSDIS